VYVQYSSEKCPLKSNAICFDVCADIGWWRPQLRPPFGWHSPRAPFGGRGRRQRSEAFFWGKIRTILRHTQRARRASTGHVCRSDHLDAASADRIATILVVGARLRLRIARHINRPRPNLIVPALQRPARDFSRPAAVAERERPLLWHSYAQAVYLLLPCKTHNTAASDDSQPATGQKALHLFPNMF
jgi:hypothetical protein